MTDYLRWNQAQFTLYRSEVEQVLQAYLYTLGLPNAE